MAGSTSNAMTRRLGHQLAATRASLGLTQKDMADHLSMEKSAAWRIEQGLFQRFATVADYAAALGYDIEIHLVPSKETSA